MTPMCWTKIVKAMRLMTLAVALAFGGMVQSHADNYGWRGGHNGGHGGHGHYHPTPSKPTPTPVVRTSSSNSGKSYRKGRYRSGGSGHGWLNSQWRSGENSRTGYTGPGGGINTPHRADWNAKLKAQRKWDEQEFKKSQQADATNMRCGLSNPPAYCYRLKGPYPTEMRVVRY